MEKTTITVTKEIKDKLNIMKYRSGFSNMSKLIENKIFTPFFPVKENMGVSEETPLNSDIK